jgi:pSer/pThr/pTyr-binding forkhead associated (FHA) protein
MNEILVLILRVLLILLSYLFIGWISYTIFKDLQTTILGRKQPIIPMIEITAIIDQTTYERRFKIPEVILGRDPACDFPLNDNTISLRHCKLSFHDKQWWAEDLDSTNGSFLNENLITNPVVLTNQDKLRLGQINLSIIID